jgi:hypothetical protein
MPNYDHIFATQQMEITATLRIRPQNEKTLFKRNLGPLKTKEKSLTLKRRDYVERMT